MKIRIEDSKERYLIKSKSVRRIIIRLLILILHYHTITRSLPTVKTLIFKHDIVEIFLQSWFIIRQRSQLFIVLDWVNTFWKRPGILE